jgi:hypothetical protein
MILRIVPLEMREDSEMIHEVMGYVFSKGSGVRTGDVAGLEDLLIKAGIIEAHPEIVELDIKPGYRHKDGALGWTQGDNGSRLDMT